jgi:hypothetical protein
VTPSGLHFIACGLLDQPQVPGRAQCSGGWVGHNRGRLAGVVRGMGFLGDLQETGRYQRTHQDERDG